MNQKKIAIVTLFDCNLGNRLQNYALQQVLKEKAGEVVTFKFYRKYPFKIQIKRDIKFLLGMCGVDKYKIFYWNKAKRRRYEDFNSKYIKCLGPVNLDDLKNVPREYDYYVTGSDQVWHNWNLGKKELEYFYLEFTTPEKRISYAPSFGFSQFPITDIDAHKCGIEGINKLSCREQDGCNLIRTLTGKEAERVIDPTFLLSAGEWRKIENKPAWISDKQIVVCYFLGEITEEYKRYILPYEDNSQYQIVYIGSARSVKEYTITPDEFLYLIDHCDVVFTDSFHACVFSLIFNKNFLAFPRKQNGMEDMKGRIENLFGMLRLKSRWYDEACIEDNLETDYEKLITCEVDKAMQYLNDCFN